MRITVNAESETLTNIICDVCRRSVRVQNGEYQYGTLQANWGCGASHQGERYELQLCEECFFQTLVHLKQERRERSLFSSERFIYQDALDDSFGRVRD